MDRSKIYHSLRFLLAGFGLGSLLMIITLLQGGTIFVSNTNPKLFIVFYFIALPLISFLIGFFVKETNILYKWGKIILWTFSILILLYLVYVFFYVFIINYKP